MSSLDHPLFKSFFGIFPGLSMFKNTAKVHGEVIGFFNLGIFHKEDIGSFLLALGPYVTWLEQKVSASSKKLFFRVAIGISFWAIECPSPYNMLEACKQNSSVLVTAQRNRRKCSGEHKIEGCLGQVLEKF